MLNTVSREGKGKGRKRLPSSSDSFISVKLVLYLVNAKEELPLKKKLKQRLVFLKLFSICTNRYQASFQGGKNKSLFPILST